MIRTPFFIRFPAECFPTLFRSSSRRMPEDRYYDVLEEVPRVRKDFGYPPLVTPTSQIVGSQAVLNVLAGERYKMVTKESKGLLRGEYGQLPAPVNEEVRKKAIGNAEIITCRPADLIAPELEKYRRGIKGTCKIGRGRSFVCALPSGGCEIPRGARQSRTCGSTRSRSVRRQLGTHNIRSGSQRVSFRSETKKRGNPCGCFFCKKKTTR